MPHRKNKLEVQQKFGVILREAINARYGQTVSSTRLSDEFNLRAVGTTTISRQTALKWLKGEAIPDPGRLKVLAEWLNLDLNEIFKSQVYRTFNESKLPHGEG